MSPDWSEVVVVTPTDDRDGQTVRGSYGRLFVDGHEIKSVSKIAISDLVGDEIPEVTVTFNPRNIRIMLDSDLAADENDALVYNLPRKLRIRKGE
jgi:hypothetical protein